MAKSAIFCLALTAFLAATTLCSAKLINPTIEELLRIPRWSYPTEGQHHHHTTEGTEASAVNLRWDGRSHDHHRGHHQEGPKQPDDMESEHVAPLDDGMKLGLVDHQDDPEKLGYSNGHQIGFHHSGIGHHLGGPRHSGRGRPNFKLIGSSAGAGASSRISRGHHHGAREGKDLEGRPSDLVVEAPHRVHDEKPPTFKKHHHVSSPVKAYKGFHHASSSSAADSSSLNDGKYGGSSSLSMSKSHSMGDGVSSSSFAFSESVSH